MEDFGITEKDYARLMIWFGDDEDEVGVYRKCPKCCRYITTGKVLSNKTGEVKLQGWECKVHGEVDPYWERH